MNISLNGLDAPPILESVERAFDLMPLAIEHAVFDQICAGGLRWVQAVMPSGCERLAEPVGVVALVAEQPPGGRSASIINATPL